MFMNVGLRITRASVLGPDISTVLQIWHNALNQSQGRARHDKSIIIVEQKNAGRQTCCLWSDSNSKTGTQQGLDRLLTKFAADWHRDKRRDIVELQTQCVKQGSKAEGYGGRVDRLRTVLL